MTDENAKKKYAHLKELIAGKIKTGNPIRDELIVSDATLNLAQLIKVRPNIDFEEAEEVKVVPKGTPVDLTKEEVKEVKKIKKISKEEGEE